jgi:hypothetical protein
MQQLFSAAERLIRARNAHLLRGDLAAPNDGLSARAVRSGP